MSRNERPRAEPEWLDKAYLIRILSKVTKGQLADIKSFSIEPATAKGETYASAMYLINAEYTIQNKPDVLQISFIVKSRLENELMSQIEEDFNIFHREAQVYTVIMTEAENLLLSIGDDTKFGPRAFYVDERVIVQENLKLKGYAIADVKEGFDYEQCRTILEKLAKFHAVSMVLYKKNPDMFRHHTGNVSEYSSPLHDLYANAIKTCIEYCKDNMKLQKYVTKLEEFGEKIIPKMINVFSRNQNDRFHVLNHGDVWVNNMMFHKDGNGQIMDVLLIDYQEGFFGSPGIDWNYFIFSSWQKDIFENRFYELLQIYQSTMENVLLQLKYEDRIPTVDDVRKEIVNKGFHGLTTATCLLPILINEHPDKADPINFLLDTDDATENRRIVFDNPNFGERLEPYLAFFVENGIL